MVFIKKGSIITSEAVSDINLDDTKIRTETKVISVVSEVKNNNELYCNKSVVSIDGNEFVPTQTVYPDYEGELLEKTRLIEGYEFDNIYDVIGRDLFKS